MYKFFHQFSNDISGDGCIFIWRLPQTMTSNMLARLKQKSSNAYNNTSSIQSENQLPDQNKILVSENLPASEVGIVGQSGPNMLDPNANQLDPNFNGPDYAFSVGKLPVWAKKQMNVSDLETPPSEFTNPQIPPNQTNLNENAQVQNSKSGTPKGRWGQRLATGNVNELELKSETANAGDKQSTVVTPQNNNSSKQV